MTFRWFIFVLSVTLGAATTAQVTQQNRERTDAAAQRAAERIQALRREAEALASQESALLVQLRKLEIERQLKVEELARVERDHTKARQRLDEAVRRADALQQTASSERPEIEARLVQIYKLGQAGFWRLMLDVDDLRSVGRAYRTAAALIKIDRDRVLAHKQTLEALARERAVLETRVRELAQLEEQAKAARSAVDRAVAARSALVSSIDAQRDLNAQMTGELQAAQQRLQASLAQLETADAITLPLRAFQGALPWPARGQLATRFGRQPGDRFGAAVVRNGIEISVTEGQLVRAVHEGTVAYAGQFTGYGNLVIVEHGERAHSLYGHLETLQVAKGDRVEAQSALGMSGRNPSGNPALYFELRVDGKPVDPLQWLTRQ